MAFPTGSFTQFLQATGIPYLFEELTSFYANLQGYLSKEHKNSGAHRDITADSLTLTTNTAANATGDLTMDGDLNCDGTVTADADGYPVFIGTVNSGSGVDMQNGQGAFESHWQVFARNGAGSRNLYFRDALEASFDWLWKFVQSSTGSGSVKYALVPNTNVSLSLGEDANNQRMEEVNAKSLRANTALYERGRTAPVGEWTSYTPTLTNITLSAGVMTARYMQVGKTVWYDIHIAFGAGDTFGGGGVWALSLPLTAANTDGQVGAVYALDNGTAHHAGVAVPASTTTITPFREGDASGFTSGVPHVWASGDVLRVSGSFVIA